MTPQDLARPYREGVRPLMPRLIDPGLALAVTVVGVLEIWVPFTSRQGEGSALVGTVGVVVSGIALTQRRNHPLPAATVCLVTPVLVWVLAAPAYVLFFGGLVPMAIGAFSVARYGEDRAPAYGAGVGAATLVFADLNVPELQSPGEIVFHWGVLATAWGFGFGLSRLEVRARESTQRAIAAEVTAAEQAMAAVVEERTRIARELHDIVAHSVSMMVVQAGAAEQVVEEDPEFVRRALATVRSTGTGALAEMRRVVAMLRDTDEPGRLSPQPGLAAVAALVEESRNSGLETSLEVVGASRALPVGLDLAAYRIVQEALTNARRHAAASRVRVELTYGDDEVRIQVSDDGAGAGGTTRGGGHGLIGMRERAALYGGSVEAGSPNGRGYVVRAVLPVAVAREVGS